MMGLPPQAREQSLGKFRIGRPPARAEPQGREAPLFQTRADGVGVPRQVKRARPREIASLDPIVEIFAIEVARLGRAGTIRCRDRGEFPRPVVIVQRDRPKSAAVTRAKQPSRRSTERPLFVEMPEDAPRQALDDGRLIANHGSISGRRKVVLTQLLAQLGERVTLTRLWRKRRRFGVRGQQIAATQRRTCRARRFAKGEMRDGASQPWPVFQGHPLSRPDAPKTLLSKLSSGTQFKTLRI